jgi:hypothetical protein
MNITVKLRIIHIDHDGMNGRDNPPTDADLGQVVTAAELMAIDGLTGEPMDIEAANADPDAALFYYVGTTADGRTVALMEWEVEPADGDDSCPTCGNRPGDGRGCDDPNGCGFAADGDTK